MPIPVAEQFEGDGLRPIDRSLAGIAGSVCCECFMCSQVEVSVTGRSLFQRSPTDCSVSN
jgi:hypothetical protein